MISIRAYGKVNLGLDVTGRREDGYHLVKMVMQTVDVYDDIILSAGTRDQGGYGIFLSCDEPAIPADERNLAYRAADLICRRFNINADINIDIRKRIPAEAGMAGGSADAAAVIRGMNRLFMLDMDQEIMDGAALALGADVPFCLRHGTYLAEGIGEKLTPLPDMMHCHMLIIKPQLCVSTAWAYKELDRLLEDPGCVVAHPDIDALISALHDQDITAFSASMGNILEEPVIRKYALIGRIKDRLVRYGAKAALMSGSGSAVFGIFTDPDAADEAFSHFEGERYGKFKVEF